jgi:hypothetical protein
MLSDPISVMVKVARAFEALGVPYMVGGSMASSAHGLQRLTQDVDFVADLKAEHVAALVAALEGEFYIDDPMIRDAIRHRTSFNVIHWETMDKADIFISNGSPWAREEMRRRCPNHPDPSNPEVTIFFSSPEDTVLHKLDWYRQGGGISDRQWSDIQGVLKVQGEALDFSYLRRWAGDLELNDLLDRALDDAGLTGA